MASFNVSILFETPPMILLNRPHPENEIKGGALKAVKQALKQEGFL